MSPSTRSHLSLVVPSGTIITMHSRPWLVPTPTDLQEPPRAIILAYRPRTQRHLIRRWLWRIAREAHR